MMLPPEYIECTEFQGRKQGMVFKTGDLGLGYYIDVPPGTKRKYNRYPNNGTYLTMIRQQQGIEAVPDEPAAKRIKTEEDDEPVDPMERLLKQAGEKAAGVGGAGAAGVPEIKDADILAAEAEYLAHLKQSEFQQGGQQQGLQGGGLK